MAGEGRNATEAPARLKGEFIRGVTILVAEKKTYPRAAYNNLTSVRMIPVLDGPETPQLGRQLGYTRLGALTGDPKDTQGRYLAVRDLSDIAVAMHEFAHVALRIGDTKLPPEGEREVPHVLWEGSANRMGRDVLATLGEDTSKLNTWYPYHERILDTIMQVSGVSFWDVTEIASGRDGIENEVCLRRIVQEGAGWDVLGFAQERYEAAIYSEFNPNHDIHLAAQATEQALNLQLSLNGQAAAA
jgi:hypothetical protein